MNPASQQIRPCRMWYAVAAIVLACGVTVFIVLLVSFISGVSGMSKSMTRVVAPGTFDITLNKPGGYIIFDEYRSVVGGRVYSHTGALGGLTCTLTEKSTGRAIPVTAASGSETYSMGSYDGRSLFDFTIPSRGVYTLTAQYAGAAGPDAVLTIGHGFVKDLLLQIGELFIAIGSLIISILVATLIVVVTLVRRIRAKKRLQAPAGT